MASLLIHNDSENILNPSTIKLVKSLPATASAKSSKSTKDLIAEKRSFGDISNRVGRTFSSKTERNLKEKRREGKCEQIHKERSKHKPPKEAVKEKIHSKTVKLPDDYHSPFPEFDFRPEINEIEDYGDVMPDRYKLSGKTISEFVRFWNRPSRVVENIERAISPTSSLELHPDCVSPRKSPSHFDLIPIECHHITPLPLLEPMEMDDYLADEDLGVFHLPPPLA